MRKYLASLFCACVAFSFVGCGDQSSTAPPADNKPAATEQKKEEAKPAATEAKPAEPEKK